MLIKPLVETPLYTNPLINTASPYLLQHAHNPVMWHPWGEAAIELAKQQDKPILLSIGYSTCYWCHVMEREIFENVSIASYMNDHFINIKVDREELPDIDELYMIARQIMTQEGGWPNNIWLTPQLKPFFAGGTFPATENAHGRPAFPRLLEWLNFAWKEKRADVERTAEEVFAQTQVLLHGKRQSPEPLEMDALCVELKRRLLTYHNERSGGFHRHPKFPQELYLLYLLDFAAATRDEASLETVRISLFKMAAGGIYDHVGCGFHRYAVDEQWFVPHFEKMLYTQALLSRVYTQFAELTRNPYMQDMARSVIEYAAAQLISPEGAFYAAVDAETDGVEGAYYAWTATELEQLLTKEELAFFQHYYALADIPTFPGHAHPEGQVIIARRPLWDAALADNMPYIEIAALNGQLMNKLLIVRNQRKAPRLDDKIITSWNGLMMDACARAAIAFNEASYAELGEKAAEFIWTNLRDADGNLHRIFAKGQAYTPALLEDYAYLVQGYLSLFRAGCGDKWRNRAQELLGELETLFESEQGFRSRGFSEIQLPDSTHSTDSVLPSPQAVIAHIYLDMYQVTQQAEWLSKAESLIRFYIRDITNRAIAEYTHLLHAALRLLALKPDADIKALVTDEDLPGRIQEPVKLTVSMTPNVPVAGSQVVVNLQLSIGKGWYIYPVDMTGQSSNATRVSVRGKDIPEILSIEFPSPVSKKLAGLEQKIYQGEVTIKLSLKLSDKTPRQPAEIRLDFQPCREGACTLPQFKVTKI